MGEFGHSPILPDYLRNTLLKEEFHDTLRVLTTEIPATDPKGETFRYYLQVSEQNTGINIRFPLSGAIEPSVFPNFQLIRLAEATPTSAEVLINIPWGEKSDEIGLEGRLEQAIVGADSFDIAADGTIALLDHVNGRMVLLSPPYLTFRSYPLALKGVGDVDIDESGKIAILDLVGEPTESSGVRVPQLYILRPTQGVEVVAPVFAQRPVGFTEGIKVIDGTDTITPIDASGRILSREEQRDSRSRPQLLIQWLTDFQTRLADPGMSLAIEIQSDHPLGAVAHFSRFNQGYVVVFEWHDFQLVWFDENGLVLKNIEVLNNRYSVFNPKGRVSVDQTGTVYILGSTPLGLEIYRIKGPEEVTR